MSTSLILLIMVQFYGIILEEVFIGENSGDVIVYNFSSCTFSDVGNMIEAVYKGFMG